MIKLVLTTLLSVLLLVAACAEEETGGKTLARVVDAETADADPHLESGAELAGQGLFEEAIAEYSAAIRLNPKFITAFSNRGLAFDALGKYTQAIEDFDEAIRLNPEYALAFSNLGNSYSGQGEYQRAIEDYNEAVRLVPRYSVALYNRGIAFHNLEQHQLAIADYDAVIQRLPDYADPTTTGAPAIRAWARLGWRYVTTAKPSASTRSTHCPMRIKRWPAPFWARTMQQGRMLKQQWG